MDFLLSTFTFFINTKDIPKRNVTIKVKKGSQALAAIERIVAGCAGYRVKVEAFE